MICLVFTLLGLAVGIPFGCLLATDGHGHSKFYDEINGDDK